MPPPKPNLPPSAKPRYSRNFDPWNSVSTGHQRAETSGPQGWRESRNLKMNSQFRGGNSGGPRILDTVGVGSEDFDDRLGMFVPKEVRARAMNSVADMLRNPGSMRAPSRPSSSSSVCHPSLSPETGPGDAEDSKPDGRLAAKDEAGEEGNTRRTQERSIFDGLVIYVNGSTHPLVSDIKLKRLLSEHGARMSLHLGRRQVTHVILGKPSGPNGGAGGGLAGGKLEKEIRRVGGCGIKFVGVEWVLESIKAGKRLPETRFANLKIAARRQHSVLGAFSKADGSTQQPAAGTPGS
ncbi:hypothetical protein B0I37DRAFT_173612 [Chaetomium sp. MPI-CAGE-AT-0009]|nr:hypothetical protein B0I37DRAFT_173612 [Chaetomium sp. MPI-CAGE-AT-0009]